MYLGAAVNVIRQRHNEAYIVTLYSEIVAVPLISPKTCLFIVEKTYLFCQWYFSCVSLFRFPSIVVRTKILFVTVCQT